MDGSLGCIGGAGRCIGDPTAGSGSVNSSRLSGETVWRVWHGR